MVRKTVRLWVPVDYKAFVIQQITWALFIRVRKVSVSCHFEPLTSLYAEFLPPSSGLSTKDQNSLIPPLLLPCNITFWFGEEYSIWVTCHQSIRSSMKISWFDAASMNLFSIYKWVFRDKIFPNSIPISPKLKTHRRYIKDIDIGYNKNSHKRGVE